MSEHEHENKHEDIFEVFDRQLSNPEVPAVEVETGVDEDTQLATFANATAGRSRDEKWAVSIATYIDLPEGLTAHEVEVMVKSALQMAANASPILMFDAKVGPGYDYDMVVEEEEREAEREEAGLYDNDEEDDT